MVLSLSWNSILAAKLSKIDVGSAPWVNTKIRGVYVDNSGKMTSIAVDGDSTKNLPICLIMNRAIDCWIFSVLKPLIKMSLSKSVRVSAYGPGAGVS